MQEHGGRRDRRDRRGRRGRRGRRRDSHRDSHRGRGCRRGRRGRRGRRRRGRRGRRGRRRRRRRRRHRLRRRRRRSRRRRRRGLRSIITVWQPPPKQLLAGNPLHCYAIGSAGAKTSGLMRTGRNLYPFVAGVVGGAAARYIYVVVVNLYPVRSNWPRTQYHHRRSWL